MTAKDVAQAWIEGAKDYDGRMPECVNDIEQFGADEFRYHLAHSIPPESLHGKQTVKQVITAIQSFIEYKLEQYPN